MANNYTTPNMNLVIPTVGVEVGPTWAQELNAALEKVDTHNHTTGNGNLVPASALDITSDLSFQNNDATDVRSVRLQNQVSNISGTLDKNCLSVTNGNLVYSNASGVAVQLTNGSGINLSSVGTIGGDYAQAGVTASVVYSNTTKVFSFAQSAGVSAKLLCGDILLTPTAASQNSVVIKATTGTTAYNVVLPTAVPASTKIVTIDSSGNLAYTYDTDNSTLEVSGSSLRIKDLGVTTAKHADQSVTTAKIADLNVTTVKIADQNVTAAKIANGTITTTQISGSAGIVGTQLSSSANILGSQLSSSAGIVGGQISSGTVTGTNIAGRTVTASNIAVGTITNTELAANSVTSSQIADGNVGTNEIATGAVTPIKIGALPITLSSTLNNTYNPGDLIGSAILTTYSNIALITLAPVNSLGAGSPGYMSTIYGGDIYLEIYNDSNNIRQKVKITTQSGYTITPPLFWVGGSGGVSTTYHIRVASDSPQAINVVNMQVIGFGI